MARLNRAAIRESVKDMVPSPQLTDADANRGIKQAHRMMATTYQWSFRRRETVIQTVAPYTTGTVTVVAGSATVTGAGTAWMSAMVGRQIRVTGENVFFYISAVNVGLQTLTLANAQLVAVPWVKVGASGQTYAIFQDQFAVPADLALVLTQVGTWPLLETSLMEIDLVDPARTSTASGTPDRWYWVRSTIVSGVETRYLGLWHVPGSALTLRVPYLIEPPDLDADTDLQVCPSEVLELAAGMKCALRVFGVTGDPRWAAVAKGLQQALYGAPDTPSSAGMLGILQQSLHDDEQRFGLPTRLGGTPQWWGTDEWALHDVEARWL